MFFWKVSPFLETSWSWAPLTCGSDLLLDPPWLLCTSQTQKEAPICFSTIKSETFYSLLRIGLAEHQTQFTSIAGQERPSVSESVLGAAWLIPELVQAFTLPEPGQSFYFFDQKPRSTASGRYHQGSRCLESYFLCLLERRCGSCFESGGVRDTNQSACALTATPSSISRPGILLGFISLFW